MGEMTGRDIMNKLGAIEIILTVIAILMSAAGSWALSQREIAAMSVVVSSNQARLEALTAVNNMQEKQIATLEQDNRNLNSKADISQELLNGISEALGSINNNLGRLDERMKNVERGVERIK